MFSDFYSTEQLSKAGITIKRSDLELVKNIFNSNQFIRADFQKKCFKKMSVSELKDTVTFNSLSQLHEENVFLNPKIESSLEYVIRKIDQQGTKF